jgi:actin-like ATPase involved in cell morphogenesis
MEHGIGVVGSALLKGLNRRIAAKTRMSFHIAENLLACMTCGPGTMLRCSRTRATARCWPAHSLRAACANT